jgi:hypothetical protein
MGDLLGGLVGEMATGTGSSSYGAPASRKGVEQVEISKVNYIRITILFFLFVLQVMLELRLINFSYNADTSAPASTYSTAPSSSYSTTGGGGTSGSSSSTVC